MVVQHFMKLVMRHDITKSYSRFKNIAQHRCDVLPRTLLNFFIPKHYVRRFSKRLSLHVLPDKNIVSKIEYEK